MNDALTEDLDLLLDQLLDGELDLEDVPIRSLTAVRAALAPPPDPVRRQAVIEPGRPLSAPPRPDSEPVSTLLVRRGPAVTAPARPPSQVRPVPIGARGDRAAVLALLANPAAALPLRLTEVGLLYFRDGMSVHRTAVSLGIARDTARRHLRRLRLIASGRVNYACMRSHAMPMKRVSLDLPADLVERVGALKRLIGPLGSTSRVLRIALALGVDALEHEPGRLLGAPPAVEPPEVP